MAIQSTNPFTNEIEATFEPISAGELDVKIRKAQESFNNWREKTFSERAKAMLKVADLLEERKMQYAEIITKEMGKPIKAAMGEIDKSIWNCKYFAENSERFLAPEKVESEYSESYMQYDPLGVILFIMPWNFPFWQVMRQAVPTLMAGNTVVLKHASNVPQSALALEELFRDALNGDSSEDIFQTLLINSSEVESIIAHPIVKGLSLTGGDRTGSIVAAQAGTYLKKSVMELGGNDAFIILNDADLELACSSAANARLNNAGQVCNSPKRYILQKGIADRARKKLVELFEAYKLGDPMNEETQMGPLVSSSALEEVESQVNKAVEQGAKVLTGGKRSELGGNFYEPTLLTDVSKENPAYYEEIFGPVTSIYEVDSLEEAVELANDSHFGLGAAIWTEDLELAKKIATKLEAGSVAINEVVKSDPRITIGGVKRSGFGRELSHHGIREFTNIKSVIIK